MFLKSHFVSCLWRVVCWKAQKNLQQGMLLKMNKGNVARITVCTIVQTVVKIVRKSIGTFGGASPKEPVNRSTHNLAEMIMSVIPLNTPKFNKFRGVSFTKG